MSQLVPFDPIQGNWSPACDDFYPLKSENLHDN